MTKTDQMNVQIMDIHGNYILKRLGRVILPDPIPNVVEETVECPECDAPVDEKDLAVDPQWKLTTQWGGPETTLILFNLYMPRHIRQGFFSGQE